MKHIWTNNLGRTFESKYDAFRWLNENSIPIGQLKLYCLGELRYSKSDQGIFSHYEKTFIKGNLPT